MKCDGDGNDDSDGSCGDEMIVIVSCWLLHKNVFF